VERLIAQRKQHLQQLDDILKSVFLEMFGDPVRNEKGWEGYLFSNLFFSSPKIGTAKPVSPDGTTPVVRVGELGEFQVNFKNCKKVALEKNELEKCRVEEGDILLARAIASQSHLGKASLITNIAQDTAFDSHVMRIRFKKQLVNPVFAYHWLKSDGGRNRFLNAGGQTSVQFNINSKQISSIKMPLPPIELQSQFATIVKKVEGIKSRYQASLADLETLYGALSQKAFKGELDLSRVSLPSDSTEATAEENTAINELKPTTDTFDLPAPPDLTTLNSAEGRNALLNQWLTVWLEHLNGTPFSTQSFIEAAQQRLWDLAEDDALELGAVDYNQIKSWTSKAVVQGRLAQTYDNANNRVQLKAVSHR
jgi:type I restriction enzyme S subunit